MTTPSNSIEKRQRGRGRAAPSPDAIAFTIRDGQSLGAPGRTKIYALAKAGRLTLRKIDGRTLIDGDSLRALLKGDPEAANGPDAVFWIANGLARKHLGWSEKRLRPVRRRALAGGWIEMLVAPAKGRNGLYRWGPTILGVPKRSSYPQ